MASGLFLAWSIHSFALVPARSDMLPLIEAGLERFRSGLDPYVAHGELAGVPLTYLPGMWLAYLPGIPARARSADDPRGCDVFGGAGDLSAGGTGAWRMAPLLAAFVLMPYLIYRHEIYFGVFWLALVLTFLLLAEERPSWSGAAFGWSLAASPFAWALAPLVALVLWRSRGWRATLRFGLVATAAAGVLILPFALTSPAFFDSVVGYWRERMNFSGFNLGFWLAPFIGLTGLRVLQLLVVAGFCLAARKSDKLSELPFLAAGMLFGIFLLNSVVWVYFYPTCILLLTGVAFRYRESGVLAPAPSLLR